MPPPGSTAGPLAAALGRVVADVGQVQSLGDEPTFYGNPANREFIDGLDEGRRARLAALDFGRREDILREARVGKPRKALDALDRAPLPTRGPAAAPPPDASPAELLEALPTFDRSMVPRLARLLLVDLGDRDRSWPYLNGLLEQVWAGRRDPSTLADPYRKTMDRMAGGPGRRPLANPAAYFVECVKERDRMAEAA